MPRPGELAAVARQMADDRKSRKIWRIDGMANLYNKIGDMLSKYSVQIADIVSPDIGSFVLGDVPVVHANRSDDRFGFRDGLAVGDADFVGAPLTRSTAAIITSQPLRAHPIRPSKTWLASTSLSCGGADLEVLCHPDDQFATQRLCRNKPYPLPSLP